MNLCKRMQAQFMNFFLRHGKSGNIPFRQKALRRGRGSGRWGFDAYLLTVHRPRTSQAGPAPSLLFLTGSRWRSSGNGIQRALGVPQYRGCGAGWAGTWGTGAMELEPHGSESQNQCVPELLHAERERETIGPRRRVEPKSPTNGMLRREGGTRLYLSWGHKTERRSVPQPVTRCPPHTHAKNCVAQWRSQALTPHSSSLAGELKMGVGWEAEQQEENLKWLTPCPPRQEARKSTSEGTGAGWEREQQQRVRGGTQGLF